MKKFSITIIIVLLILCGCNNTSSNEDEIYIEEVEKDLSTIETATKYIDYALLIEDKQEAYDSLRTVSESLTSDEELSQLKEFTQYLDIRLIEKDYYSINGNDKTLNNIEYYRYDENGRIIKSEDVIYFYLNDGGDAYYYTMNGYSNTTNFYDKENNLLYSYDTYQYNNDIKPYNDKCFLYKKYDNEFNNDGKIINITINTYDGDGLRDTETISYEYDPNGNIIKETRINSYSLFIRSYTYDEYNNVIREDNYYKDDYNENKYSSSYENKYDSKGRLIKKSYIYEDNDNEYGTSYTYDELYDVILTEKSNYQYVEYKYELALPTGEGVGLLGKDLPAIVSGNATKAVRQRKILATNIKVRKTPTTHEDNQVDLLPKDTIVDVYNSVHNEGYSWHQIGIDRWIADDGTWTEEIN